MTRCGSFIALATFVAAELAAGGSAGAQVVETTATPAPNLWSVTAGVRTAFIKDPGFDPFSNNDAFTQFSLSGSGAIARRDRTTFVAGLILDLGSTSATARDAPSRLSMTRLSVLLEGRHRLSTRLYGFARVAPGLLHGSASLDDASSPSSSSLTTTFDAFSLDASAGAAFRFGALGETRLGVWLVGDGGYGWVQSEHLVLAPSLGVDQSKAGTLDLGSLAPRGGFFRLALALSY